ncbi:hypothetical protein ACP70R_030852 [Stipagrostis hirtigluma subsp. patula]
MAEARLLPAGAGGPRRSARLWEAAMRSPPPPPPARKRSKKVEEGSAEDAGAEFTGVDICHLTPLEVLPYFRRLYKKRANMALVFYHKNNPGDLYEFVHVRLNDVYDFRERIPYLHMNFKAKNTTTGSEHVFFAELAFDSDVSDKYGRYRTNTCSIVDDNCVGNRGGRKHMLSIEDDPEGYDEDNCYVCSEKIKHPAGSSYKGGHYTTDYWVNDSSVE